MSISSESCLVMNVCAPCLCVCAVVIEVPADYVNRLVEYVRVHVDDVDIVAPVCMCLSKLAEHPANAGHIISSPVVGHIASLLKRFMGNPRAVEAIVSLLRPLSVDMEVRVCASSCDV